MPAPEFLRQAGGYALASLLAFALDMTVLAILVSGLGLPYLVSSSISFLAGSLLVYWLCIRHIFEYRRLEGARQEFAIFVGIGVVGLGLNLGIMYSAVGVLGMHYLLGKVLAACSTFGVNFGLRRFVLFAPGRTVEGVLRRQPH